MARRRSRAFPVAAALLAVLLVVPMFVPTHVGGIVNAPITVDGNVGDWTPVFTDPANAMADRAGPDDPDNPGTSSRDLSLVAYTWDSSYVYFYFRRTTTGTNSLTYNVYIDRDGDGMLENTDMVLRYTYNGNSYQGATLNRYAPVVSTGDTMGGDGVTPPGGQGAALTATGVTSMGAANGIEVEGRIAWSALSLPSGSPLGLHFACGRNSGIPGAIEDNTGNLTTRYRAVTVTPDNNGGTQPGTTLRYTHTITNGGNGAEGFDLTSVSSQSWATTIYNSAGTAINGLTLAGKEATTVVVAVKVPPGAPYGARDVTTIRAVCRADPAVAGSANDETMVGRITVSPYRQGGMAQSGVVTFQHTLSNNTTSNASVSLAANSANGWSARVYDAAGTTPLSTVLLSPGATMTITVKITVPVGAALGTVDLTTIQATLLSDPGVIGIAYDTVTVQKEVTVEPDNANPGGPGTTIAYQHTVTNSWSTTRTITLNAVSSRGWPVSLYDSDAVTKVTSVTLAPFGGSRTIYCRVTIPSGTAAGVVDTTTVTGSFGSVSDSAKDVTTASNLVTYNTSGYVIPSTTFSPGDTVFARAMGVTASSVRFQWSDASGTVVYTTPLIGVDVTQMAGTSYSLPASATLGVWTLKLFDSGGAQVGQPATFTVNVESWLTLTIDVSTLDFGHLDPGVPVPPRSVGVNVDSSAPYTITPSLSGDVAAMGLAVSGQANGVKPKGTGHFFDNYQVNPPWTTDPQVPLHASVLYTVVQQ